MRRLALYGLLAQDDAVRAARMFQQLGIDVLGALYLGGANALSMAAAGRIEGASAAVSLLHRLFRTDVAPWCEEIF